ncbi:hypothetical protein [Chromobacterium phragmitis]|uniref:hypothetical protein n=1 Tax=Chromobacterium phragmitis TaxID=2202141 RepID=UPI0011AE6BEF|nr:hypothetical protein [Chromobacterium phragmitis]
MTLKNTMCPEFDAAIKIGMKAIKDKRSIEEKNPAKIIYSIDLDEFMKTKGYHQQNRWDYLVEISNSLKDGVHAIEIHPTGGGQPQLIIEKKRAAIQQLNSNAKWAGVNIISWHWILTKNSSYNPMDKSYLKVQAEGIKIEGKTFKII